MSNQLIEALSSNASFEHVKELLHLYPDAVKVANGGGNLPLNTALSFKYSSDVIKATAQELFVTSNRKFIESLVREASCKARNEERMNNLPPSIIILT